MLADSSETSQHLDDTSTTQAKRHALMLIYKLSVEQLKNYEDHDGDG